MSTPTENPIDRAEFWTALRARHPRFWLAVIADARVTAMHRGERHEFRSRLDELSQVARLAWVSDAFGAQMLYRAKARLQTLGVPVLPRLAHRLAIAVAQVSIGDPVLMAPGVYIVHGQVVADGLVVIETGVVISPFVTLGLRAGDVTGPTVHSNVTIGTGAKLIGPITVGAGARIGANAVVVDDVAPGATVVGAPARERTPSA
jgi:serine O-acetyltransferase